MRVSYGMFCVFDLYLTSQLELLIDIECYTHLTNITLIARFMGPTWGRQNPGGPHVGQLNLAIWVQLLSHVQNNEYMI